MTGFLLNRIFCFGACAGLHGAFLVGGVRVRRGGLVVHTGLDRVLGGGVLLCGALRACFVQCLRDQVQHEVPLGELFAGAERFVLQVALDALEEFLISASSINQCLYKHQ